MDRTQIFAVIRRHLVEIVDGLDGREIVPSKSMRDYGADSLEIVEVVSRSMKELGIRIQRTDLATAQNLNDLITLFEQASTARESEEVPM